MKKYKPVSISKQAFIFCRYSLAFLIWLSLVLQIKWILILVFVIFILSYFLKIQRSPMVMFYDFTIGRLFKKKSEIQNENAMRFAHLTGAVLTLISLILLYLVNDFIGWIFVLLFALLKSISAFGFCPASKLYECTINNKNCCSFIKR